MKLKKASIIGKIVEPIDISETISTPTFPTNRPLTSAILRKPIINNAVTTYETVDTRLSSTFLTKNVA